MDKRDLRAMYTTFKSGSKINLWCEKSAEDVPLPPQKKRKTMRIMRTMIFLMS